MKECHFALDSGSRESGWVAFQATSDGIGPLTIEQFGTMENGELRAFIERMRPYKAWCPGLPLGTLCVEMMQARGMPTANEEFETCVNVGRFIQLWPGYDWSYVFRGDVKLAVCGSTKAKDSNVRQGLIDLWGGEDRAIGGKKCPQCKGKGYTGRKKEPCPCGHGWLYKPGPLAKMSGDAWAALGVAVAWSQSQIPVQSLKASYKAKEEVKDGDAAGVGE